MSLAAPHSTSVVVLVEYHPVLLRYGAVHQSELPPHERNFKNKNVTIPTFKMRKIQTDGSLKKLMNVVCENIFT